KSVLCTQQRGVCRCCRGVRFWKKHSAELCWCVGFSHFRPCLGGWARSVFYERRTAHDLPPSQHRFYLPILSACFRTKCRAEYYVPSAVGLPQTRSGSGKRNFGVVGPYRTAAPSAEPAIR